jgi:hypothetical protein
LEDRYFIAQRASNLGSPDLKKLQTEISERFENVQLVALDEPFWPKLTRHNNQKLPHDQN